MPCPLRLYAGMLQRCDDTAVLRIRFHPKEINKHENLGHWELVLLFLALAIHVLLLLRENISLSSLKKRIAHRH